MAARLSMDLRQQIVGAYDCGNVFCRAIAVRFGVPASTVGKVVVQQSKTEKPLEPHDANCGRNRSITGKAETALEEHLRKHPNITLRERKDALGLTCSVKTVNDVAFGEATKGSS